jgi:hypothetical protein
MNLGLVLPAIARQYLLPAHGTGYHEADAGLT